MPPQLPLDVILGVTPVPGLSAAFNILKLIISSVEQAHRSKRQLHALAASVAQLLETLNTEFRLGAARIVLSVKPLKDLYSLLDDIQNFIREEQERPFYKVLLTSDSRMAEIDDFYRRIGTMASAFQISTLLNIQRMISNMHSQHCGIWVGGTQFDSAIAPASITQHAPAPGPIRILIQHRETDPYFGFTNSSSHSVRYNGKEYPTSEHLFQALKYIDRRSDIAEKIRTTSTSAAEAFKLSMTHLAQQHPDWDRMRIAKMNIVTWHKFNQNPSIKQQLLNTGEARLIFYVQDDFWGVGKDQRGANEQGKVLEKVRTALRSSTPYIDLAVEGNQFPQRLQNRPRVLFHPLWIDANHGFANSSPHPVKYNGKEYPTSEHLFQAFKYMDNHLDIAEIIRTCSELPQDAVAQSTAHSVWQHPDWDIMSVSKMEIVLWHKFGQNEDLKQQLLGTGDAELVHFTTNPFWGVGSNENGRNEIGKALERVRSALRKSEARVHT